jgi:hypothetical protein
MKHGNFGLRIVMKKALELENNTPTKGRMALLDRPDSFVVKRVIEQRI